MQRTPLDIIPIVLRIEQK